MSLLKVCIHKCFKVSVLSVFFTLCQRTHPSILFNSFICANSEGFSPPYVDYRNFLLCVVSHHITVVVVVATAVLLEANS